MGAPGEDRTSLTTLHVGEIKERNIHRDRDNISNTYPHHNINRFTSPYNIITA